MAGSSQTENAGATSQAPERRRAAAGSSVRQRVRLPLDACPIPGPSPMSGPSPMCPRCVCAPWIGAPGRHVSLIVMGERDGPGRAGPSMTAAVCQPRGLSDDWARRASSIRPYSCFRFETSVRQIDVSPLMGGEDEKGGRAAGSATCVSRVAAERGIRVPDCPSVMTSRTRHRRRRFRVVLIRPDDLDRSGIGRLAVRTAFATVFRYDCAMTLVSVTGQTVE